MKIDLTDMTFGLLTAKEIVGKSKQGTLWRCECDCGGEKIVPAAYLRNGHTSSCGCIVRNIRENAIKKGDRWGRLEAVEFVRYDSKNDGKKQAVWKFHCDCGNDTILPVGNVKFARVRSCGCIAREHSANLKKEDITGETFDRLTAIRPTAEREDNGSVVWEFQCECGNITKMSVFRFHSGRVHSCGCLYQESRKDAATYRKDFIGHTSISTIVASKSPRATNSSGHTGVWLNPKTGRYESYISFKKKRYRLGQFKDINDAIRIRKEAEKKLHDPIVLEHFQNLTPERKKEFLEYVKSAYTCPDTLDVNHPHHAVL